MKEKTRFVFIDLMRGWALLVMIEVHVFNVLLIPSLKESDWFHTLNFVNGLVAPAFLFISGFAFMLSTRHKLGELREFKYPFWKKLGRIMLIFLAGYSIHLPILSLRRIINYYDPQTILKIYNVDILQCIAAGLLIMFAARIIFKSDLHFDLFNILILTASVLLSPLISHIDFGRIFPVPIAAYFNSGYGSLFPLFPWLGFLFAGAVSCKYYLEARATGTEIKYIKTVFITGVIMAVAGHLFFSDIFPESLKIYRPHPLFFIQRLGYVLMILSACWYYVEKRKTESSFVLDIGRESLLIYWLHLQLIYRRFWNDKSTADILGQSYGLIGCIIGTILLTVLMIAVAKYWSLVKKKYRSYISNITFIFVLLLILIFFIGF